jgi:hypothetical protein
LLLYLRVSNHDEPPMLRITAARSAYRSIKKLNDEFIGNRIILQPAHRTCGSNRLEQTDISVHGRYAWR